AVTSEILKQLANPKGVRQDVAGWISAYCGGNEGFAKVLWEQVTIACAEKPGSKTALDAIWKVVDLIKYAEEERRRNEPAVSGSSDEQLAREFEACCIRMLADDPQLLAALAEDRGFRLVPDDGGLGEFATA